MSAVYECRLSTGLTWNDLKRACIIYTVCEQHAIDGRSIAAMANKK